MSLTLVVFDAQANVVDQVNVDSPGRVVSASALGLILYFAFRKKG